MTFSMSRLISESVEVVSSSLGQQSSLDWNAGMLLYITGSNARQISLPWADCMCCLTAVCVFVCVIPYSFGIVIHFWKKSMLGWDRGVGWWGESGVRDEVKLCKKQQSMKTTENVSAFQHSSPSVCVHTSVHVWERVYLKLHIALAPPGGQNQA